ncbi:hypothetical protein DPMN_005912 [Dreissena polymorpha]|uniref:Uncharacterized protein n=1 Tax=Dreissena polymorpha TaxID=45954 RepID=A0A9D4RUY8_DREPO|nr:hypothetical protein DPMN_005912 [Dreissena polymorpha]
MLVAKVPVSDFSYFTLAACSPCTSRESACGIPDERVLIRRAANLREVLYRRHCPQLHQAQERVPTEDVQRVGVPAPGR